jgi:hypothetical protein
MELWQFFVLRMLTGVAEGKAPIAHDNNKQCTCSFHSAGDGAVAVLCAAHADWRCCWRLLPAGVQPAG